MILLLFIILLNFIVLFAMYLDVATAIDIHALHDVPFVTGLLWFNLIALGICLLASIQAGKEIARAQRDVSKAQYELAEERMKE